MSDDTVPVTVERGSITIRGPDAETEVVDARDADPTGYVTEDDTILARGGESVELSIGGESA